MTNKYQLVLEFADDNLDTYDRVVALEEKLVAELVTDEIDGHDVGEGVVNIFIHTSDPRGCFKKALGIMKEMKEEPYAAGFRELDENDYRRLWPGDDSMSFELR